VLFADSRGTLLRRRAFDSAVTALGLCDSSRIIIALAKQIILWDPDTDRIQTICSIETDLPQTRLNDGKVGPDGCFWVGSMHDSSIRAPIASLYRIGTDGSVARALTNLKVANGLSWTADGERMCVSDSAAAWIDVWTFNAASGAMTERRRLAQLTEATGRPDGGAFDTANLYWSAGVSAGRLNAFDLGGQLIEVWHTPISAPTMCAFGGADGALMFVTSHSLTADDLSASKPIPAGSVLQAFARRPGVLPFRYDDRRWQ